MKTALSVRLRTFPIPQHYDSIPIYSNACHLSRGGEVNVFYVVGHMPLQCGSFPQFFILKETLINGMRESGKQTLVHGKEAGSENNGDYLRVLLTQPGAKVCRQISAGLLISVSLILNS